MFKRSLILASALTLTAATGCSTNVNQIFAKNPNAAPTYINHEKAITDPSLNNKASVPEIIQAKRGNLLEVQATLQNNTSKQVDVYYIIDWYDTQGIIIKSRNARWQKITLKGMETRHVTSLGLTPDAVDFRVKLQEKE